MSNSRFWRRSAARVVTICWSHVGPHIHTLGYLDGIVYEVTWRYMRVYEIYEGILLYPTVYEGRLRTPQPQRVLNQALIGEAPPSFNKRPC